MHFCLPLFVVAVMQEMVRFVFMLVRAYRITTWTHTDTLWWASDQSNQVTNKLSWRCSTQGPFGRQHAQPNSPHVCWRLGANGVHQLIGDVLQRRTCVLGLLGVCAFTVRTTDACMRRTMIGLTAVTRGVIRTWCASAPVVSDLKLVESSGPSVVPFHSRENTGQDPV